MELYKAFNTIPSVPAAEENDAWVPYVMMNNLFSENEVDRINALWNDAEAKEGGVGGDNAIRYEKRKAKELFIKTEMNEWIYDKIGSVCLLLNTTKFKMEIQGFRGPLRFLRYEPGDFFSWHMDYGVPGKLTRKLVVCIQLSGENEYEGGELQLMTDAISAPKAKGSAVIFPSYLLHRVTPVISGCRKSLIALIAGPPFK